MRRIVAFIFLVLAACSVKKPETPVQSLLSDETYPAFTQPTFAQSYPDQLTYSDGTIARRNDDYLMLYFDMIPSQNDIERGLKLSEVRTLSSDTIYKSLNNSRHVMWVKKGSGSLSAYINNLKRNLGGNLQQVAPVYYFGDSPDPRYLFAPMPNTLLVKDSLMNPGLEDIFDRAGLNSNQNIANYRVYTLSNVEYTVFGIINYLREIPGFDKEDAYFVENIPFIKPQFSNDTYWQQQAPVFNQLQIPSTWPVVGTLTTRVAVIDCGVNLLYGNPVDGDLNFISDGFQYDVSRVSRGARPDAMFGSSDHGTGVTALMTAKQNNSRGISGVAPGFPVLPLSVVHGSDVELAAAIEECIRQGVSVINMSIGTYSWRSSVINPLLERAWTRGCVMVAASGNERFTNQLPIPAAHRRVMAVGGSNGNTHDGFSNFARIQRGSHWKGISVVAPSVNVATVNANGIYSSMSGTSAASPLVAGVAALIKAKYPTLTNQQIRNAIEGSASKIGSGFEQHQGFPLGDHHPALGYGQLNATAALQWATPPQASMIQTNLEESALVDEVNLNSRKLSAGMIMLIAIALAGSAFLIMRFTRT